MLNGTGDLPFNTAGFSYNVQDSTSYHFLKYHYHYYTQNAVSGSEAKVQASVIIDTATVTNDKYPSFNSNNSSTFWIRDASITIVAPVNTMIQSYRLYGNPSKPIGLSGFARGVIRVGLGSISASLSTAYVLALAYHDDYIATSTTSSQFDTFDKNVPPNNVLRKWNTVMDSQLKLYTTENSFKTEVGIYNYDEVANTRTGKIYFDCQVYNNLSGEVYRYENEQNTEYTVTYR